MNNSVIGFDIVHHCFCLIVIRYQSEYKYRNIWSYKVLACHFKIVRGAYFNILLVEYYHFVLSKT